MKKILSAILCLLVCAQAFGFGSISPEAEGTKEMFFDSFDYKAFGSSGLYGGNNAWEKEYLTPKDGNDKGSADSTAPVPLDGVLKLYLPLSNHFLNMK